MWIYGFVTLLDRFFPKQKLFKILLLWFWGKTWWWDDRRVKFRYLLSGRPSQYFLQCPNKIKHLNKLKTGFSFSTDAKKTFEAKSRKCKNIVVCWRLEVCCTRTMTIRGYFILLCRSQCVGACFYHVTAAGSRVQRPRMGWRPPSCSLGAALTLSLASPVFLQWNLW